MKKKGELPPNNSNEEQLCEQTRMALFDKQALTKDQKKHFDSCAFCRAYQAETDLMLTALTEFDEPIPLRNGMALSDSVMHELDAQAALFGRTPHIRHARFRHAGLAAACVVLAVMATPTILGLLNPSKGNDFASLYTADDTGHAKVVSDAQGLRAVESALSSDEELDGDEAADCETEGAEIEATKTEQDTSFDVYDTYTYADTASDDEDRRLLFDAALIGAQSKESAPQPEPKASHEAKKETKSTNNDAANNIVSAATTDGHLSGGASSAGTSREETDQETATVSDDLSSDSTAFLLSSSSASSGVGHPDSLGQTNDGGSASAGFGGSGASDSLLFSNDATAFEDDSEAAWEQNEETDGSEGAVYTLTDVAFAAAEANFGVHEIIPEPVNSQQFDTVACVTFATADQDVQIQVFLEQDSDSFSWHVSRDSNGNAQIFEVHTSYSED